MMTEIAGHDLDQWIEKVSGCKYLDEDKLKILCERVCNSKPLLFLRRQYLSLNRLKNFSWKSRTFNLFQLLLLYVVTSMDSFGIY